MKKKTRNCDFRKLNTDAEIFEIFLILKIQLRRKIR